jgi:hypothetical protein
MKPNLTPVFLSPRLYIVFEIPSRRTCPSLKVVSELRCFGTASNAPLSEAHPVHFDLKTVISTRLTYKSTFITQAHTRRSSLLPKGASDFVGSVAFAADGAFLRVPVSESLVSEMPALEVLFSLLFCRLWLVLLRGRRRLRDDERSCWGLLSAFEGSGSDAVG